MLDFSYSVPPPHLAHEAGVTWGLARGFARGGRQTLAGAAQRKGAACAASARVNAADAFGSATTPAAPWLHPQASEAETASGVSDVAQTFARVLDEVDYGIVVLTADAGLLYANHAARHELASRRGLRQIGYVVAPVRDGQAQRFSEAVRQALLGKRSMLALGASDSPLMVAVTPIDGPIDGCTAEHGSSAHERRVMLAFGKSAVCEPLSFQMFARLYGLSATEFEVLRAAVEGLTATEIAHAQGVASSTVRTHLNSVRAKTGARTVRSLIARIGALPPIVPAAQL
jgi:DNA-binding CsgD family transcriptional regulator